MKGSIQRRGNSWRLVVDAPPDAATGRRRQIVRTIDGHLDQREVEDILARLLVEVGACSGHHDDSELPPGRPLRRSESGRRYPLEPLLSYSSMSALSQLCGLHRETLYRWRRTGGVDEFTADALAVAAGLHPTEVWPAWALTEQFLAV